MKDTMARWIGSWRSDLMRLLLQIGHLRGRKFQARQVERYVIKWPRCNWQFPKQKSWIWQICPRWSYLASEPFPRKAHYALVIGQKLVQKHVARPPCISRLSDFHPSELLAPQLGLDRSTSTQKHIGQAQRPQTGQLLRMAYPCQYRSQISTWQICTHVGSFSGTCWPSHQVLWCRSLSRIQGLRLSPCLPWFQRRCLESSAIWWNSFHLQCCVESIPRTWWHRRRVCSSLELWKGAHGSVYGSLQCFRRWSFWNVFRWCQWTRQRPRYLCLEYTFVKQWL